jgi:hypothetical protein
MEQRDDANNISSDLRFFYNTVRRDKRDNTTEDRGPNCLSLYGEHVPSHHCSLHGLGLRFAQRADCPPFGDVWQLTNINHALDDLTANRPEEHTLKDLTPYRTRYSLQQSLLINPDATVTRRPGGRYYK